jgi:hypothetical protein
LEDEMTNRRFYLAGVGLLSMLAAGAPFGCDPPAPAPPSGGDPPVITQPEPEDEPADYPSCTQIPACDSSIHVDSKGPALMITDPEVLAKVPLKRVMEQLVASSEAPYSALDATRRLFDTMNSTEYGQFDDARHCDDGIPRAPAPSAIDSFTCPRAEGKLAFSSHLLEDGHPDSFIPVAIVNRFDLTPLNAKRCGQYRIIYAKRSGLTDPTNRLFLIFEPALMNPNRCLEACRPIAEDWQALEGASTAEIADFVEAFFFEGIHGFAPMIHPSGFGPEKEEDDGGGSYGGDFEDQDEGGQIRLGMQMDAMWGWRELRYEVSPLTGDFDFVPTTVKNNPVASLFTPENAGSAAYKIIVDDSFPSLVAGELDAIQVFVPRDFDGVESMLAGEKKNDYYSAATQNGDTTFIQLLDDAIAKTSINADCPPGDPLDGEAILDRATTQSCAGCHAPSKLIGPDRSIGCGLTWPDTLGEVHVNEKSEISPALKDVFLPHRARVLETFLQACDLDAMFDNLQTGKPKPDSGFKTIAPGRTLGGSGTH